MAALAIPLITAGISGLAGLFGKKQSNTSNTTYNSTNNSTNQSSTAPSLTGQQQGLIDQLLSQYTSRLNQGADMSGYAAGGLQNINKTSNIAKKMSDNMIASRGLSNSPYAGFQDVAGSQARAGEQSQFLNQIPLLQRSMQGEDLSNLMNLFKAIPTAYNSQGSSNSNTSGTQNTTSTGSGGGGIGGLLGGLGAGLAGPNGDSGQSNLSSIFGSLFPNKAPQGY